MEKLKESLGESQGVENPSRRQFLRGVAAAGVGATLAKWVSSEEKIGYEGLKVPGATFYPVYERHDQGPHPSQFEGKPPFDVFSIEFYSHRHFPPNYLIPRILFSFGEAVSAGSTLPPDERRRRLKVRLDRYERLFYKLASDISYLVFPDVELPGLDNNLIADFMDNISFIEAGVSSALAVLASKMTDRAHKIENEGNKRSPLPMSRREFIAGLSKAGALYFASPLVSRASEAVAVSGYGPNDNEFRVASALRRVAIRLNGIQSNFHPEDVTIFVRNLVWAIKLWESERWFKDNSGDLTQNNANIDNANIGFLAGAAHSGVEDLLVLGKDFCADVLGLLPKSYLRALSAANGGVENVSSIRIISPLTPRDVGSIDGLIAEAYKRGMYGVIDHDKYNRLLLELMLEEQFRPSTRLRSILESAEN